MDEVIRGALIAGSLIVAIGAQNAFVLKQGLLKNNIFWVSLTCFLCDLILMIIGVLGIGTIISSSTFATVTLAIAGGLFLAFYGVKSFRSAWLLSNSMNINNDVGTSPKIHKTILLTLAITLLNPHVYLDTVVIIGGVAGTLTWNEKIQFLIGALIASFIWFFGLGYGARWLIPLFKKPVAWRILDFGIGCVMIWLSYQLIQFALVST
ncbi:LysE/ArgO family amino acid transporter [Alteribacillus bidgolensis]|uniref:L-lysine exporter family protein LysE/ArgO n=1 Tax=Alteribacillus bidgolensis TaxID=930129 RepID=A0A1G8R3B2_9BACI|nr:LysE/ArgO family amino acid transporter [Alteribacillus bidgolensis]SDJ11466.1 L-lysine exporter family protein LysE/ArgO [Alteribacillus bidgolensis]